MGDDEDRFLCEAMIDPTVTSIQTSAYSSSCKTNDSWIDGLLDRLSRGEDVSSLTNDLLRNTANILKACNSQSALASNLNMSQGKLSSLIELMNMTSSSVSNFSNNSGIEKTFLPKSPSKKLNSVKSLVSSVSVTEPYTPRKSEFPPEFMNSTIQLSPPKTSSSSKVAWNHNQSIIDITSPPRKNCNKKNPSNSKQNCLRDIPEIPQYDFFGNDCPEDNFNVEDEEEYMESDNTANNSRYQTSSVTSSFAEDSYRNTSTSFTKSPPRSPNKKLGTSTTKSSKSPCGFLDAGKFEPGNFLGKVQNDGITGEFDGFNYGHSKIMQTVCVFSQ
jgi:hypothetical protein